MLTSSSCYCDCGLCLYLRVVFFRSMRKYSIRNYPAIFRVLQAALLLLITIMVGVIGFIFIEGMSFLDAGYMTIITMSTVGYEVVGDGGLSPDGKVFAIFLIIFTIGTFAYFITTLTTMVIEGEIRNLLKKYQVNKGISKLREHIIICGLGRNGKEAALELVEQGEEFVIVEKDEEVIRKFLDLHPRNYVLEGDATDESILHNANITQAKGVVIALADDADNVFTTLTVRELNPYAKVVARASNERTISKLRRAGADRVILPNQLGGRKMAKIITTPDMVDFVDMITGQGKFGLKLELVDCESHPGLIDRSFSELQIKTQSGVLVLGTQFDDGHFELNPDAHKPIVRSQKLFIIGTPEQIDTFHRIYKHKTG